MEDSEVLNSFGQRVVVVDDDDCYPSIHNVNRFIEQLQAVFELHSIPNRERYSSFILQMRLDGNCIRPEKGEHGNILCTTTTDAGRQIVIVAGEQTTIFFMCASGISLVEGKSPCSYEGYTKDSEGFLTNPKNWATGLSLV